MRRHDEALMDIQMTWYISLAIRPPNYIHLLPEASFVLRSMLSKNDIHSTPFKIEMRQMEVEDDLHI